MSSNLRAHLVASLAASHRTNRAVALLVGTLAGLDRARTFPAEWLFDFDAATAVVQGASWLGILAVGLVTATATLALLELVRRRSPVELDLGPRARWAATGVAVAVAVGAALRLLWWDLVPPVPWIDPILALRAAAAAGRWLAPWEFTWFEPRGPGVTSHVVLYGLYVDFVRLLLHLVRDRWAAYVLLDVVPALPIPLAAALASRQLSTDRRIPPLAAAITAVAFWPLLTARIGWIEQAQILLDLLAVERIVAGVRSRRAGPLATGGLLAGLAAHTYAASWPTALGIALGITATLVLANEVPRARKARLGLAAGLGFGAVVAPLAPIYLAHPELLGGRAQEIGLTGTPLHVVGVFLANVVDFVDLLFFAGDPLSRHAIPGTPETSLLLVAAFVLGLAAIARSDRRRLWLVPAGAALILIAAGAASSIRNLAPNAFRTGLLAPLAAIVQAEGIASLLRARLGSLRFRRLAIAALLVLIATLDVGKLLDWACPATGYGPNFGDPATWAGSFAAIAGPDGVVIDPGVFVEHTTPWSVAFLLDRDRPLAPLVPPAVARLATGELESYPGLRWYVTFDRAPGRYSVVLGPPGSKLRAIRVARPPSLPGEDP